MNLQAMQNVLDWGYDKAVNGVPGVDSAIELANDYLNEEGSLSEQVDSLIRWQNTKCATSGFVTNLGGLITLPVAIPANISSTIYIQLRMIAAIAYMGGYDLKNDKVKTLAFLCLCGNEATKIVKDLAIQIGTDFATQFIRSVSIKTINQVNKSIGMKLITNVSEKSVASFSKCIPLIGGVIGGTIDGIACNTVGNVAKRTFIKQ